MRSYVTVLCAVFVTTPVVIGDPPKPAEGIEVQKKGVNTEGVQKKFYRYWLQVEETTAGVTTKDPARLSGRGFSAEAVTGWARRTTGELSRSCDRPGPRIDPTAEPMRLDLRIAGYVDSFPGGRVARADEKLVRVLPCIFKFDGDDLVIAHGDAWVVEKELPKGEDYPGRPADFTSTKKNKRAVERLKPCAEWDQD